jgi:hypothetical protein
MLVGSGVSHQLLDFLEVDVLSLAQRLLNSPFWHHLCDIVFFCLFRIFEDDVLFVGYL